MIKILKANNKNYLLNINRFLNYRRSRNRFNNSIVKKILYDVKKNKQKALIKYERKFSNNSKINVNSAEINQSIKKLNPKIKLHMIGKLQSNKVKFAVQLFDYIHSVDSEKLAKKIADEQNKINRKIKIFLQVNIGEENQKSGVNKNDVNKLVLYCKELGLDLIGLMCIPPLNTTPDFFFKEMNKLNQDLGFSELSMGMSSDFLLASKYQSTFVRIGSSIFGQRS